MSKRVTVESAEYLEPADYERFGLFPQQALDAVVGGAIGYPARWSAFTITRKNAQEITVSPGIYFENEIVYSSDDSFDMNLILNFPNAASDERWLALIARGDEVPLVENRAFETSEDPETSEPVENATAVVLSRKVELVVQLGTAVPAPAVKPTIAETDACIAFIRVTTGGIQDIVPGELWRAKTLHEVEGRVTSIELLLEAVFESIESIETNIANLAARQKDIPDPRIFQQLVRDTARHGQALNLPTEARNYFFDQALLKTFWEPNAGPFGGLYRIDEGIRYGYAAQRDHILRVADPAQVGIRLHDNITLLPDYTEVVRISAPEGTGRKDIANVVHTITTAVQHTVSHQRIRYGATINVCENTAGWTQLGNVKAGAVFQANGQEFVNKGLTANPWNQTATAQAGHSEYAVQRIIKESYESTYTSYNVEEFGLSGAMYAQTFQNSQVMVATAIELNFTRVGPTGDVTLCLCETGPSGAPSFDVIIARSTISRADLVTGWNKFQIEPTLLDQGKRYAWFTVTAGNHQVMCTTTGNAYTGGSSFVSTDGGWAQGSILEDFTFRLYAAKFKSSRTVIPFEALMLENGMTEVDMIYQAWEPDATSLVWEVRPQGATEWAPMDARDPNPLANLPPLVQLRLVMIGTEDVAPGIRLDNYARAITGRLRNDMRAISKLCVFDFPTDEAQIVLNMDYYDPAKHTVGPKLILANGTVISPDVVTSRQDPAKLTRRKFVADFTLPANTPSARIRIDSTSNNILDVCFGQDVQLNAF